MIVLDAVGAGELPDAAEYGDEGSNTLGNVATAVGGLDLPNLEALGLGNVMPLEGASPIPLEETREGFQDRNAAGIGLGKQRDPLLAPASAGVFLETERADIRSVNPVPSGLQRARQEHGSN